MLSAVLGLFSKDLAVDLGSSNTRIHLRGTGVVCEQPSVVAVQLTPDGRRRAMAFGVDALPMIGRTPDDILAVQPVRGGTIDDHEVAEALLVQLVRRAVGASGFAWTRMAVAVPTHASDLARRALRDSCVAAGARELHLVPRPIAAALGAGLPAGEPRGHLIADIGGSSVEISLLSMGSVVASATIPGGGEAMDRAIVDYIRRHHAVEIGRPSAEHLKCMWGSAVRSAVHVDLVAKGRCLRVGVPRAVNLSADDVHAALSPAVAAIATAIGQVIERAPPELASDVVDQGVVLVGMGAELDNLAPALTAATGIAAMVAEQPGSAVCRGAASLLEQLDLLERVAS